MFLLSYSSAPSPPLFQPPQEIRPLGTIYSEPGAVREFLKKCRDSPDADLVHDRLIQVFRALADLLNEDDAQRLERAWTALDELDASLVNLPRLGALYPVVLRSVKRAGVHTMHIALSVARMLEPIIRENLRPVEDRASA